MKTLLLLRHAKSSWKDSTLADHQRPLNDRGRRAAVVMGQFIRKKKLLPDLILVSTAARARETAKLLAESGKLNVELRFDPRLYLAEVDKLLEIIARVEDDHKQLMVIGHNPGMEELLCRLTGQTKRMPTAALAQMQLRIEKWPEVASVNRTPLERLIRPKELATRE